MKLRRKLPTVEVVRLQPGDVVVVKPREVLTQDAAQRIYEQVRQVFPDNSVVVLDDGLSLTLYRKPLDRIAA